MKFHLGGIILTAVFLPATFFAQAKETPSLIINEISWMGNFESYSNEWIELYNPNDFEINLDSWVLKTERKSINIILEGKVKPKKFYLLERTNDNTVKDIKADLIYKGALSNEGERIILYNKEGIIIDDVDCSLGWFEGNNETKETMERIDPFSLENSAENWQTGPVEGSPKSKNLIKEEKEKPFIENQPDDEEKSSFFSFSLLIALFSSFLILILKKV